MPSSRTGPTSSPRPSPPRTSARPSKAPDPQATANTDSEATTRRRIAAEALRWACHVAGLLFGSTGPSPLAGRALWGLKRQFSRGAAETAIRVTLEALAATGRESPGPPPQQSAHQKGCPRFCPYEKALGALDFSLRAGFGSLAIPSKLVGVREHQGAIRCLNASGARFGTRLGFRDEDDGLAVTTGAGTTLGYVQRKHEPWLRVLLARSTGDPDGHYSRAHSSEEPDGPRLGVCLLAVTGDGRDGRLHGVNVAFVRVSADDTTYS